MIKIQEHIDRIDVEDYLDTLTEELWNELNPKVASGKRYKVISLIEKCKKYATASDTPAYLTAYANNDAPTAERHKNFFNFLTANDANELKKLIISKPISFAKLKSDISKIITANDLFTGTPGNYSQTNFGKLLTETIFDYTKFRSSEFCKDLFSRLGFASTTCPYCNDKMVIITKIKSNSTTETKLKAYLDLDHFYSKSQNPFFALSFFNLIPTCHDCNSHDKGDKPFTIETHIHPYHEAFENFYQFKVRLNVILGDVVEEIIIEKLPSKPLDRTLDDLNLINRYNNKTDILQAQELVRYFINYRHLIGTPQEKAFKDAIFGLGRTPKELKDVLKSPKGKMNRDILKQVDINKILGII